MALRLFIFFLLPLPALIPYYVVVEYMHGRIAGGKAFFQHEALPIFITVGMKASVKQVDTLLSLLV